MHARYRTSSHDAVTARFNERFILSLGSCSECLVLDDELNVLPISRGKNIKPSDGKETNEVDEKLTELKNSLAETKPVGELIKLTRTVDQVRCLTFDWHTS